MFLTVLEKRASASADWAASLSLRSLTPAPRARSRFLRFLAMVLKAAPNFWSADLRAASSLAWRALVSAFICAETALALASMRKAWAAMFLFVLDTFFAVSWRRARRARFWAAMAFLRAATAEALLALTEAERAARPAAFLALAAACDFSRPEKRASV